MLKKVLSFKQQYAEHINMTLKSINVKNDTYYFLNGMNDLENFGSNLLRLDKRSYKNIGIYYIGYITINKI